MGLVCGAGRLVIGFIVEGAADDRDADDIVETAHVRVLFVRQLRLQGTALPWELACSDQPVVVRAPFAD